MIDLLRCNLRALWSTCVRYAVQWLLCIRRPVQSLRSSEYFRTLVSPRKKPRTRRPPLPARPPATAPRPPQLLALPRLLSDCRFACFRCFMHRFLNFKTFGHFGKMFEAGEDSHPAFQEA